MAHKITIEDAKDSEMDDDTKNETQQIKRSTETDNKMDSKGEST